MRCPTTRAMMSFGPPGGNGTIRRIVLLGKSCATARVGHSKTKPVSSDLKTFTVILPNSRRAACCACGGLAEPALSTVAHLTSSLRVGASGAPARPARRRDPTRPLLTLILILNIVLPSGPPKGRSHEASCGWDRMRRPARGRRTLLPHPGCAGAPPCGQYEPPARSWLTAAVEACAAPPERPSQTMASPVETTAGLTGRPPQSAARRGRKTPQWRAERRPRSERDAASKNNGCATWRAIPLALCEGQRETGLPGASTKNTGDDAWVLED